MRQPLRILVLVVAITLSTTVLAAATPDTDLYQESFSALTILFVTAILLENALAVIFNWRVFLTFFNLRGLRTLIMIGVSWAVVKVFHFDTFTELLATYGNGPATSNTLSTGLTALILAGGSSGIHNLMVSLGLRDKAREDAHPPKAPKTQAWIAIRVRRQHAVGTINVAISKTSAQGDAKPALAGTLTTTKPSLKDLFLRNKDRFPNSGGYVVEPHQTYEIELDARDADNNPIPSPINGTYTFAPGAVIDFETTL
jgi:hypothetical protein